MRPEVLALHIGDTIRGAIAPMQLRVNALETAHTAALSHTAGAISAIESVIERLDARLTDLEGRPPVPGPPGPAGPPGRDGHDGKSLNYLGVHVSGKTYDVGDLVTAGGSAWYCARTTKGAPGTSTDWQLMVKRGRDARGDR